MNKKEKTVDSPPFSQKHPKWNFLISLLFVLGTVAGVIFVVSYIIKFVGQIIGSFITWVSTIASTLDAVIIVTLITGTVSIAGVIISSIVGKSLEYKKARLEYLAQKREKPYGDFIAMYYKILMSNKTKEKYTQEEIIQATGLSKSTVSQLFSGKYYNYQLSTLETIAKFFNCKIQDILVEVEDEK